MKVTIASLLLFTALHASAAFSINLPGNTETGTWSGLNSGATPAAPALDSLISAVGSSAVFTKVSGGAYYIGSGIYGSMDGSNPSNPYPSTYSISDNSPIVDLATIVFQARMSADPSSITLSLNGATSGPLAGILPEFAMTAFVTGNQSDRAWQWDLSGVTEEITSYTISFTNQAHTAIYSSSPITVQTSDSFVQVVPEPTTGLLAIAPLAFVALRRRRAA